MTLQTYLTFAGASLVLIPGPDMIYMLSRCMAQGRRAGATAAFGINAGAYVHLTAAVTGLSAILMTSAIAFTAVRCMGAAYLIYLGVRALFDREAGVAVGTAGLKGRSLRAVFWQGFLSDALNPKVAIFFLALLPQFVNPRAGNVPGQLLLLGLTCNMVAITVNLVLVLISARLTRRLRDSPRMAAWLHKAMGAMFIGLGLRVAAERA